MARSSALARWLGGTTIDEFRADYLKRWPLACAGSASDARILDWLLLGRMLGNAGDILVVSRGSLLDRAPPRNLGKLVEGFRAGVGVVLRDAETLVPALRALCDDFVAELGPARIQIFATPADAHGFGWHFDDEDVFIAQTVGVKDYYFRDNTLEHARASPAAFARYPEEASPLHCATLAPGDFLYLPARWWHVAEPREHALSISIGVDPRT